VSNFQVGRDHGEVKSVESLGFKRKGVVRGESGGMSKHDEELITLSTEGNWFTSLELGKKYYLINLPINRELESEWELLKKCSLGTDSGNWESFQRDTQWTFGNSESERDPCLTIYGVPEGRTGLTFPKPLNPPGGGGISRRTL